MAQGTLVKLEIEATEDPEAFSVTATIRSDGDGHPIFNVTVNSGLSGPGGLQELIEDEAGMPLVP